METKWIQHPTAEEIAWAGAQLRAGALVAIPTETVYGLGANALDPVAIQRIYQAKGRPSDNPLILHVPDKEAVRPLVTNLSSTAEALMDAFWPGPLTLTLPKADCVPDVATGGLSSVAVRCPSHALCHELLVAAGVPVAAPSANRSGRPSPTTAADVMRDMDGRIAAVLDGGTCPVGIESTVVEVGDNAVTILRPGAITESMLRTVVDAVYWDAALVTGDGQPKAPGMKYKHYAPDAPMTTWVGESEAVARAMAKALETATGSVGVFASQETYERLLALAPASSWEVTLVPMIYGQREDLAAMAHAFYEALLRCNAAGVTMIMAEGTADGEFGRSIMNRMDKASAHHIEYV